MRPVVRLRLPDGTLSELEHGDVIGRVWSAGLVLDDPRVSEAHALISLREGAFWVLSLRRMLAFEGRAVAEIRLIPGARFEIADGLTLTVEEVELPDRVWTLEAEGLPRVVLPSVCSVRGRPRPQIVGRFEPNAPCVIWSTGESWRLRLDGAERTLTAPDAFQVDGIGFRVVEEPAGTSGPGVTLLPGGVHAPLHVVAAFDTVQIHRDGEPVLMIVGVQARIVSELAQIGQPVSWRAVAAEVWPDEASDAALRKRWDVAIARLRVRLRTARIRADLLHADGSGNIELLLRPDDRVDDRT